MKRIYLTLILALFFITTYGQTAKEIQKNLYETMLKNVDQICDYDAGKYSIGLKLDSLKFGGNHLVGYFSNPEKTKLGKGKNKRVVKKNTIFTFDGGDATVVMLRRNLDNWKDKRLVAIVDIENKKILFDLM